MVEPHADDDRNLVVFLCDGATCSSRAAMRELRQHLLTAVRARGWQGRILIDRETCFGHCRLGPNMLIAPAHLCRVRAPLPGTPGTLLVNGLDPARAIDALRTYIADEPATAAPRRVGDE